MRDETAKLVDLYVTFRRRFVKEVPGNHIFVPRGIALLNSYLEDHLNHKYAVAVFAGPKSSKFVCFDVDIPDKHVVHKVVMALVDFGFPRDRIYVSTSGNKGFHIEMFFTDLMYTSDLLNMYETIIARNGFDRRKIEFRPTSTQAIKLPLSIHPKTGRVCWFLDTDTLQPIEDMGYIFQIQQIDRDWAKELIVKNADVPERNATKKNAVSQESFIIDNDQYPMITEPGTRNKLMTSIAVYERRRGTPQEDIERILVAWASKQNLDYVNSPWDFVVKQAGQLARWVWSDKFSCVRPDVFITENDLANVLKQHARMQKRVLFLIIAFFRKYGNASMSVERIIRYVGGSVRSVRVSLDKIEAAGLIEHRRGKAYYENGNIKSKPNQYIYRPDVVRQMGKKIPIDWDFKEEGFDHVYFKTMCDNVLRDEWGEHFTKKELNELEEFKTLEKWKENNDNG